ncbi:MAG: histidinol phosphatase [Acidobacteria bacterium]|nr:histidinol phosphatase [Acidobacteriota bacterium]
MMTSRRTFGWLFVLLSLTITAQNTARKYTTVERLQPEHLRAVHEDRLRHQQQRKTIKVIKGYNDYRAIMHVHAEDATHTGGTRPELLAACKRTGVNVVMLTNHVRPPVDFITDTWRGLREGVLFIPGAEHEGFLSYPMKSILNRKTNSREEYIQMVREGGGNIFLSHIEERPDWATDQLTGMEIYNHHADFKGELEFLKWLPQTLSDPDGIVKFKQLLADYPMEFFGATQDYLQDYIKKWDADSQQHRVTGVAANDCHHNQVITVKVAAPDAIELWLTGDKDPTFKVNAKRAPRIPELTKDKQPGDIIAVVDIDPYDRSLSYVTTHILAQKQNESSIREALNQAHAYVSHDWFCDPTGFAFVVNKGTRQIGIMGDGVKFSAEMKLSVAAPTSGMIRLFRNGAMVQESKSNSMDYPVTEPGTYRAEVWLELDGEWRPWIYANQVRVLQ